MDKNTIIFRFVSRENSKISEVKVEKQIFEKHSLKYLITDTPSFFSAVVHEKYRIYSNVLVMSMSSRQEEEGKK